MGSWNTGGGGGGDNVLQTKNGWGRASDNFLGQRVFTPWFWTQCWFSKFQWYFHPLYFFAICWKWTTLGFSSDLCIFDVVSNKALVVVHYCQTSGMVIMQRKLKCWQTDRQTVNNSSLNLNRNCFLAIWSEMGEFCHNYSWFNLSHCSSG